MSEGCLELEEFHDEALVDGLGVLRVEQFWVPAWVCESECVCEWVSVSEWASQSERVRVSE